MPIRKPSSNAMQKTERQRSKKKSTPPGPVESTRQEEEVREFLELDRLEKRICGFIERYLPAGSWADFEIGLLAVAGRFDIDFRLLELSLSAGRNLGIVDVWQSPGTFPEENQPWRCLEPDRFEHAWWQATQEVRHHFAPAGVTDIPRDSLTLGLSIPRANGVRYLLAIDALASDAFPKKLLEESEKLGTSDFPGKSHKPETRGRKKRYDVKADALAAQIWRANKADYPTYEAFVDDPPIGVVLPTHIKTGRDLEMAIDRYIQQSKARK